eukprot:6724072-Pyramimonas_sp.AAC.1
MSIPVNRSYLLVGTAEPGIMYLPGGLGLQNGNARPDVAARGALDASSGTTARGYLAARFSS